MRQIRFDIERKAVQRHPARYANPDRGDLVFKAVTLVRPPHPDADPVVAPFTTNVEGGESSDDQLFNGGDEAAYVRRAAPQIEHQVADALAGAVIGELPATA